MALEPDFLLLDEPLSALDAKVRLKLREQIRSLYTSFGVPTCIISPLFITTILSAKQRASSWSCVTIIVVMPSF
ncbi:hypothetical protein ACTPD5_22650, partial [Clostridioides difficile]